MSISLYIKLLFLLSLTISGPISAHKERYPDPEKELDVVAIVEHDKIKCKCDPTDDPCCHPPTGTSSNRVKSHRHMHATDVAECQCDTDTDPCCKRMPGTSHHK